MYQQDNVSKQQTYQKRNNVIMLIVQSIITFMLTVFSVLFVEFFIRFGDSTCYTLPLNHAAITDGRDDFALLCVVLCLFWAPLLYRRRFVKYFVFTAFMLLPSVYYMYTFIPFDAKWHDGLCF